MIENKEKDDKSSEDAGGEQIRLQKYIAECGIMSRRAAEKEITDGNVFVNGKVAELGMKIDPSKDEVKVNGNIISDAALRNDKIYVMLNKPVGFVTTMKDEKGRRCVSDLVSDIGARIYPVGRLDYDSEGLLIMTNDGELTNRLTHPRHSIPKIYDVTVSGDVGEKELEILTSPLVIDGYRILPVKVKKKRSERNNTVLGFELYEGRNRQIRKMCEAAGLRVLKLKRTAIGELSLGGLKSGSFRYLTNSEIEYLRK